MRCVVVLYLVASACANAEMPDPEFTVDKDALSLAAGRMEVVTADRDGIAWTVDHPDIATVAPATDGAATIHAVKPGKATVSATMGAIARSIDVTVTDPVLDRIEVTSTRDIIPRGLTLQLVANGTFSDQHVEDLSANATWKSADGTILAVDASGKVSAVKVGATEITASVENVTSDPLALSVSDAALQSISMNSPSGPLAKGLELQFVVTGIFTDASSSDITDLVSWSTTDDTIVSVDHAGLAKAVAASGTARVTAMATTLEAHADITVAPAILVSLAITPNPLSIPLGVTTPLTATGTYSDQTTMPLTSSVLWSIQTGTSVTITQAGVAHAATTGTSTIKASMAQVNATVDATVGAAAADHLELSAGDMTLMKSQRVPLKARMVYSDSSKIDVTAMATWSASGTSATVAGGVVDATTTSGATTITAMADGKMASLVATVGSTTCHLVINEVQSAGAAGAGDEWVELYNPCNAGIDTTGWTLVYRGAMTTGATDSNTLQALSGTINANDFRLYAGSTYPGGNYDGTKWSSGIGLAAASGAIGLRSGPKDTGPLVDALGYGTVAANHPFMESAAATALATSKSVGRAPFDGNDTDNNQLNFALSSTPTPRAANQ